MGYLLAIGAVVLWGLCQVPIKMTKARGRVGVLVSMPAGLLALLIVTTAAGLLRVPAMSWSSWLSTFAMGVCMFPLATFTYFEAVKLAGITTAAPMTRLTPILVVVAAAVLGLDTLRWNLAVAGCLLFGGGILCARGSRIGLTVEGHANLRAGMFYAFVATLMWTAGYIAEKLVHVGGDRAMVTLLGLAFGTLAYWLVMALIGRLGELKTLSLRDVLLYASQGVMSFALAYWAVFEANELLGVSQGTLIAECWPAAAVLVGLAVFREPMNLQKGIGVFLLIASGVLASV